jgi:hypothetical protein
MDLLEKISFAVVVFLIISMIYHNTFYKEEIKKTKDKKYKTYFDYVKAAHDGCFKSLVLGTILGGNGLFSAF